MPLSAYAKAIAAFIATLAAAFVAANTDNAISPTEVAQLVALAATAAAVLVVPNLPTGPQRYIKQALAFVGAAATALMPYLVGDGTATLNEWVLVVLAGLQVLGVIGLPNQGYGSPATPGVVQVLYQQAPADVADQIARSTQFLERRGSRPWSSATGTTE